MKYNTQELKEIYASLKQDYSELRKKQKAWLSYIDRTYDNGLDKDKYDHHVKLPTGMWIVESPVNYLALDKIRVNQRPRSGGQGNVTQEARKTADAIGAFEQALLDSWQDIPPYFFRVNLKHLTRYGEACYKVQVAPEVVVEQEGFEGIPFLRPEPVHPLSVMHTNMSDDYGCPNLLFNFSLIYVMDLQVLVERWNKEKPGVKLNKGWRPRDKVLLLEWWTAEERGYLAGPEEADIVKDSRWDYIPYQGEERARNLFGFTPYIIGDSGLGEENPDGKPHHYKMGLLEGLEDAIKQQSRNETRFDTLSAFLTWPEDKWDLSGDATSLTLADVARKPGEPVIQTPTKKHEWGPTRPIPPALTSQSARTDGIFERYQPSVVRGAPTPGEPAASVASRHDWATQNLWEGIHLASKYMLANALKLNLKMIDKLDLHVEWGGVRVNKEMVNGHYALEVKLRSGDQEEQRWKREQGKGLWGFMSPLDINEDFFDKENATQAVKETFAWRLVESVLTNLNGAIGQSIVPMIAEGVRLKLIERKVLPEGGVQQNKPPVEGSAPAVNGSPAKGITELPNQTPEADSNMQRLMALMNTPAGQ